MQKPYSRSTSGLAQTVCQLPELACICCVHMGVARAVCASSPVADPLALQWWVSGRNYAKYSPEGPRPIAIIKVQKQIQL